MTLPDPDLRRTWLFGPGADKEAHAAMLASGADALIIDLEDFTPPNRREEARGLLPAFIASCRAGGSVPAVRINALDGDGSEDLAAALDAGPAVILLPMAERVDQMAALDAAITQQEQALGLTIGATEIVPVCETALGVVDVRAIATGSPRIRCALLGAEDLASDLRAERGPDAVELDHARRRFILDCRAAGIEPIDAPYTYSDTEGAVREARYARRLGYQSKALVRPEHAAALNAALTPTAEEVRHARAVADGFTAARERGEDRTLVDGHWVEAPAYRNALRLIERAERLGQPDR